ncbi:hypothetical protein [Zeimonas arvi]|uniref:hypothetical protein n=1 Tax=Zeimonas arvi TaxID=2498847 RepID=UPI00164FDFF1|nr:hypothetical protein [Zeimonas arvi]
MSSTKPIAGAALLALALLAPVAPAVAEEGDGLVASEARGGPARADVAFGRVLGESELAGQRGGNVHVNQNNATATVEGNVASNLATGNNTIADSAFSNANGVPMVVQNSGNNVVIQNSTILNLQLK